MSISTNVNVQLLSEYFDLSPFNELKKQPSLASSKTSGNFRQHFKFFRDKHNIECHSHDGSGTP